MNELNEYKGQSEPKWSDEQIAQIEILKRFSEKLNSGIEQITKKYDELRAKNAT